MWRMFASALLVLGGVGCRSTTSTPSDAVPSPATTGQIILATTTSTQDTGLLDVLVPLFEQQTGYAVKTVAVGTGAALALGARGEADVVLAHAPEAEEAWMQAGNGTERLLVMHNDFLLVAPPDDPAGVRGSRDAASAFAVLAAQARGPFVSRGDQSGTHIREQQLWQRAGIDPRGQPWYLESGSGMGQTLVIADQRRGYTLTDRGTWLAYRQKLALAPVLEGDPALLNIYHVMPVNPPKFPEGRINLAGGQAFARFLVGPDVQRVIANFGRDTAGEPLFVADAGAAEPGRVP